MTDDYIVRRRNRTSTLLQTKPPAQVLVTENSQDMSSAARIRRIETLTMINEAEKKLSLKSNQSDEQDIQANFNRLMKFAKIIGFLTFCLIYVYFFWILLTIVFQDTSYKLLVSVSFYFAGIVLLGLLLACLHIWFLMKRAGRHKFKFLGGLLTLFILNSITSVDLYIILIVLIRNTSSIGLQGLYLRTIETVPISCFMLFNFYVDIRVLYWATSDIKLFRKVAEWKSGLRDYWLFLRVLSGLGSVILVVLCLSIVIVFETIFEFNFVILGILIFIITLIAMVVRFGMRMTNIEVY